MKPGLSRGMAYGFLVELLVFLGIVLFVLFCGTVWAVPG